MSAPAGPRLFQVLIETALHEHMRRIADIETWLREWRLGCQLIGSENHGTIRAAFRLERHARALELQFGGRRLTGAELDAAVAEDELHDAIIARDLG